MAYAYAGEGSLDYSPCHYGTSKLLFRGPRRDLALPYVAVLGGTETYGKFIPRPWPSLVEDETGLRCINLGCVNAGADVYLADPGVMQVVSGARMALVQVMGAGNLTNRFYAVHPRRNDRFLRASDALVRLYPEVDFTNFNFTRHLLQTLQAVSATRFEVLADELRRTWVTRMEALMRSAGVPVVLVWVADRPPAPRGAADLSSDPLLVDRPMIDAVAALAAAWVQPGPAVAGRALDGMAFAEMERPAAEGLPGPGVHEAVAQATADAVDRLLRS
ncbi:MAG: DUF6473 family protein [Gemmobacter sp.]